MSLFTSYSDANKIVSTGRTTRYSSAPEYFVKSSGESVPIYYTVQRFSGQSYAYVGMTKAAAETCATAMHEKYTLKYNRWTAQTVEQSGTDIPKVVINREYVIECSATISLEHEEGNAWKVSVSENNSDTVISESEPASTDDFATLFQMADSRENETSRSIAFVNVYRKTDDTTLLRVEFSVPKSDYDSFLDNNNVVVVKYLDASSTERTITATHALAGGDKGKSIVFANVQFVSSYMPQPITFFTRIAVTVSGRTWESYHSTTGTGFDTSAPKTIVIDSSSYSFSNHQLLNVMGDMHYCRYDFDVLYHANGFPPYWLGLEDQMVFTLNGENYTKNDYYNRVDYMTCAPVDSTHCRMTIGLRASLPAIGASYGTEGIRLYQNGQDAMSAEVSCSASQPWVYLAEAPSCTYNPGTFRVDVTMKFKTSLAEGTVMSNAKLKKLVGSNELDSSKISLTVDSEGVYTFVGTLPNTYGETGADVSISINDPISDTTCVTPVQTINWYSQIPTTAIYIASAEFNGSDTITIDYYNVSAPAASYDEVNHLAVQVYDATNDTWNTATSTFVFGGRRTISASQNETIRLFLNNFGYSAYSQTVTSTTEA